ncbi:MAG: hypothetical protein M3R09_04210, partial [Actinomycetota bacterium]|nr:hypothetical protein [Actinomycetota bacterium]
MSAPPCRSLWHLLGPAEAGEAARPGKTAVARLLAGYLAPDRGRVLVDGEPLSRGGQPVQLVSQHPELAVDPRWRLAEILAEARPVDADLLDALSIARGWLDRYPHELSGG